MPLEFFWHGKVAKTMDHLPHIHQPTKKCHHGGGLYDRGVALATSMGQGDRQSFVGADQSAAVAVYR